MIKTIRNQDMGRSELGWLHSIFHFSFAEYYHPDNIQFGNLRVVNDDIIEPGMGFDTHPHKDMEIVSYVVDGVLTHKDSMGNQRELTRGQVQYMSAGTGVFHSEYNLTNQPSRFLQIWILPDQAGYQPNYGDFNFEWSDREHQWLHLVSDVKGEAIVNIHQDMNIYVTSMDEEETITHTILPGRQVYVIQIEGTGDINGFTLNEKDAAMVMEEDMVSLTAKTKSHYMLFDMKCNKS